jgi:hypothetical protein
MFSTSNELQVTMTRREAEEIIINAIYRDELHARVDIGIDNGFEYWQILIRALEVLHSELAHEPTIDKRLAFALFVLATDVSCRVISLSERKPDTRPELLVQSSEVDFLVQSIFDAGGPDTWGVPYTREQP